MTNYPQSPKFLLVFKETDEITRKQVHSYPALHELMKLGMIEYQKGPTYKLDIFRITEAGKKMLAGVLSNGDQA
jgi:DNA-binding PadR family transcriptional regulator